MTVSADSSISTNVLSIDHTLFIFSSFFPYIIDITVRGACSEST